MSLECHRWTSIFRPERRLRSGGLLEQGESDLEAAVVWLSDGVVIAAGRPGLPLSFSLGVDRSQRARATADAQERPILAAPGPAMP